MIPVIANLDALSESGGEETALLGARGILPYCSPRLSFGEVLAGAFGWSKALDDFDAAYAAAHIIADHYGFRHVEALSALFDLEAEIRDAAEALEVVHGRLGLRALATSVAERVIGPTARELPPLLTTIN